MLVDHGAVIDARDAAGKTPLFCLLANRDDRETLEWMVARGADPRAEADFLDRRTGVTTRGNALVQAAKYRRVESLRALIERTPECLTPSALEQASALVQRMILHAKKEREAGRPTAMPLSPSPAPRAMTTVLEVEREDVTVKLEEMENILKEANDVMTEMGKKRAGNEAQRRPSLLKRLSNKFTKQATRVFSEIA